VDVDGERASGGPFGQRGGDLADGVGHDHAAGEAAGGEGFFGGGHCGRRDLAAGADGVER
jgi:hypothetical protein